MPATPVWPKSIADLLADVQSGGDVSDGEESDDLAVGDEVVTNEGATVYGDNAYGTGAFQERLEEEGIESRCKTQNPTAAGGLFTKDRFDVDVAEGTVTCPNGVTVVISPHRKGGGMAYFRDACATSALRPQCTTAAGGRTIGISAHEEALARARLRQVDPAWREDYRATRPRLSASWPTSCVAATAGAEPGYADGYGSTPISLSWPRQRTWRAWPRSRLVRSPERMGGGRVRRDAAPLCAAPDPQIASGINEWAFRPTSMAFSPQVHKAFSTATDRPTGKLNPCFTPPTQ